MFYINLTAGAAATETGNLACARVPRFVEAETQNFVFSFLSGTADSLPGDFFDAEFYITGGTAFNMTSPCFRSAGVVDAAARTVSFAVNTYTEQYLQSVQQVGTPMYVEISRLSAGDPREVRIALLDCLADPRVWIDGLPPEPVSAYYTKTETDALLANFLTSADLVDYVRQQSVVIQELSSQSVALAVSANKYYKFTSLEGEPTTITDLTITSVENSIYESIIEFSTTSATPNITIPVSCRYLGEVDADDNPNFTFEPNKSYMISFQYNTWIAGELTGGDE